MHRSISRAAREQAKRTLHRVFLLGQRLGFDLLPRHFYSDIPDLRELRRTQHWRAPLSMYGIAGADVDEQLEYVRGCCPEPLRDRLMQTDVYARACEQNGAVGFGPIEAELLYCFIQTKRPSKIVQVGAGVSTAVILHAAADAGYTPQITCVDPFPTDYLKRTANAGAITLLSEPAQTVDLNVLSDIGQDQMLFIDSTHTTKVGSEVNRLIFEVLPRLRAGATVHVHDILFPFDYSPVMFDTVFFGRESSLLYAFLLDNSRYRVHASLSMLHHARAQQLKQILPHFQPAAMDQGLLVRGDTGHFPSSIYLGVAR